MEALKRAIHLGGNMGTQRNIDFIRHPQASHSGEEGGDAGGVAASPGPARSAVSAGSGAAAAAAALSRFAGALTWALSHCHGTIPAGLPKKSARVSLTRFPGLSARRACGWGVSSQMTCSLQAPRSTSLLGPSLSTASTGGGRCWSRMLCSTRQHLSTALTLRGFNSMVLSNTRKRWASNPKAFSTTLLARDSL